MDIDFLRAALGCHFSGRQYVVFMAVNAAGGKQAHQVHSTVAADGFINGGAKYGIFRKTTFFYIFVDACQALINHPASAQVHVPNLGITHLSLGQADKHAGGVDECFRLIFPELIPTRGVGVADGVVFSRVTVAPAIKNDQCGRLTRGSHHLIRW